MQSSKHRLIKLLKRTNIPGVSFKLSRINILKKNHNELENCSIIMMLLKCQLDHCQFLCWGNVVESWDFSQNASELFNERKAYCGSLWGNRRLLIIFIDCRRATKASAPENLKTSSPFVKQKMRTARVVQPAVVFRSFTAFTNSKVIWWVAALHPVWYQQSPPGQCSLKSCCTFWRH